VSNHQQLNPVNSISDMEEWYPVLYDIKLDFDMQVCQVKSKSNSNVNVKSQGFKLKVTCFEYTMKLAPHNTSNQRSCRHSLLLNRKSVFDFHHVLLALSWKGNIRNETRHKRRMLLSGSCDYQPEAYWAGHADLCSIITKSATKGKIVLLLGRKMWYCML